MRKNGVNRELIPIDGGVCAPEGFKANGVSCVPEREISQISDKEDLALIIAERPYPTACVYSVGPMFGAPVAVTKKHLKNGYAQAILVNSGIANVFSEDGEMLAEQACKILAKKVKVYPEDVVIASTGTMSKKFTIAPFLRGMDALVEGVEATHEKSLSTARAIMTTDTYPKQLSFSFFLGDYICKIGAIFKGNVRVCPNLATMLCFITTDVQITPEMLHKALSFASKETFNLLTLDGTSSPNDTVCIMASGKAGNHIIDCEDSEYKKFIYFLEEVMRRICVQIALDGRGANKLLVCKTTGARSKRIARTFSKAIVRALNVKSSISIGKLNVEDLIFTLLNSGEEIYLSKIIISISSSKGRQILFEENKSLKASLQTMEKILEAEEVQIVVELGEGNYSAFAYGCSLESR